MITYETFGGCRDLLITNKLENIIMSLIMNTKHYGSGDNELPGRNEPLELGSGEWHFSLSSEEMRVA